MFFLCGLLGCWPTTKAANTYRGSLSITLRTPPLISILQRSIRRLDSQAGEIQGSYPTEYLEISPLPVIRNHPWFPFLSVKMPAYYWPLPLSFLLIYFFMTSGKIVSGNPRGFTQSGVRTNSENGYNFVIVWRGRGYAKYLVYSTEVDLY